MSFKLFFDFTVSFKKDMVVPAGTHQRILAQIERVESELGYKREKYKDNPWHWNGTLKDGVTDTTFCEVVEKHNSFAIWLFGKLNEWEAEKLNGETETITVEQSRDFMPGLRQLSVPFENWTEDYFEEKLTSFYEIIRGRDTDGASLSAKPLSEDQAREVVVLLHEYIIGHERFPKRYDVSYGRDYLIDSEDAAWCEQKGRCVDWHDVGGCDDCDVDKCNLYQEDCEDDGA